MQFKIKIKNGFLIAKKNTISITPKTTIIKNNLNNLRNTLAPKKFVAIRNFYKLNTTICSYLFISFQILSFKKENNYYLLVFIHYILNTPIFIRYYLPLAAGGICLFSFYFENPKRANKLALLLVTSSKQ